ncbi:hypothetical protein MKX03_006514 [Papaver bracteatum]|nr:hypothetical protein MKX03_006514 [Papaver bracteatum]
MNIGLVGCLAVSNFVIAKLLSLPMPTVAAVSGHAAAAGFFLALSHDYILTRKGVRRDVLLQCMKIRADKAVGMGIVDFFWDLTNGMVKSMLISEMNSFPEICKFLGFVADFKSVVPFKSKL